ncbi:hypothetical protein QR680_005031 [Steinernema hermaphroditum]|uniref:Invertebrate defensins family profile domain-containing protein n=1 Tax=Steinernema hermaphroditum TaxID=289476 RepID=A0AA39HQL9_9BILA|nr:hypothetical protein QR680_005031 [Steinernema hermaphroditum]
MRSAAVFLFVLLLGATLLYSAESIDVDMLKTLAKAQLGNLGGKKKEESSNNSVFNKKNLCMVGCLAYGQCKKSENKRVKLICHEPPTCNC